MRIADGRTAFVQWDTGQQIVFDAPCAEAHFAPRTGTVTIDVETRLVGGEYVADVPDELLQTARPVTVYAYVQDAARYTRQIRSFEVRARPKPADYIYTPTERETWEQLQAQIGDMSALETEAKDNLVAAINEAAQSGGGGGTGDHTKLKNRAAAEQHPMSAITGLTEALDGKQPTGDYLTAKTLQAATDAALAQAKTSGEFDGANGITPTIGDNGNWYLGTTDTGKPSRGEKGADGAGMDVTNATVGQIAKISAVDDNGVPTAWEPVDMPSGGGGETWEKIAEIELTADVQIYELASFNTYRKVKVMMIRPAYIPGLNKNVWFDVAPADATTNFFYSCGYMTAGYGYVAWNVTVEINNMFITSQRVAANNLNANVNSEATIGKLLGDTSLDNMVMRMRFNDTSIIQPGDKVTVIGVRK